MFPYRDHCLVLKHLVSIRAMFWCISPTGHLIIRAAWNEQNYVTIHCLNGIKSHTKLPWQLNGYGQLFKNKPSGLPDGSDYLKRQVFLCSSKVRIIYLMRVRWGWSLVLRERQGMWKHFRFPHNVLYISGRRSDTIGSGYVFCRHTVSHCLSQH